jgi:hypothetical protein
MQPLILTAAGFLIGMFLLPLVVRWAALVHTVFGLHGGDFLGGPKRRLLWAAPLVILLHPVPYLVIGSLVIIDFVAVGRASTGWVWFLAGLFSYSVVLTLFVVARIRKLRKKAHRDRNPA